MTPRRPPDPGAMARSAWLWRAVGHTPRSQPPPRPASSRSRRVRRASKRTRRPAFTLLELLVTISIVALLLLVMLPSLAGARATARTAACASNLRQLGAAWTLYAGDHADRAMPLAYWAAKDVGNGPPVYWWGRIEDDQVDHVTGLIAPYLDAAPGERSAFECPAQSWGTYAPQGGVDVPTSTYGYNGYYLSPSQTPGWAYSIGHRPWRRLSDIRRPTDLFVFADAMLGVAEPPRATALLDPPRLFDAGEWNPNPYPTTAFRHAGAAVTVRADASAHATPARPAWLTQPGIGSVGTDNAPHYVPDAADWTAP